MYISDILFTFIGLQHTFVLVSWIIYTTDSLNKAISYQNQRCMYYITYVRVYFNR